MILITGGAGYIGSHLTHALLVLGHDVLVYDNFSNTSGVNIDKINAMDLKGTLTVMEGDITSKDDVINLFRKHDIMTLIHLAGLKSVRDSMENKDEYYRINVEGSKILFGVAASYGVTNIVFSSSACVYLPNDSGIYRESDLLNEDNNYYAYTKLRAEEALVDIKMHSPGVNICILRYFNPVSVGSLFVDESIEINNLFPTIANCIKTNKPLVVYGDTHDTPDGTPIRDYLHVEDLVSAHILILKDKHIYPNVRVFNVGTGRGYSVKEVIGEFNSQIKEPLKIKYADKNIGDSPVLIACADKITQTYNWIPKHALPDMVSGAY